ncbi:MAG: 4Fe-4S binding protein, partial [Clostridia bacterium]|nr:4Fe-4S binding protein [Clostridia bacterium]
MNLELQRELFDRGADIVRFLDISELPEKQTQGFNKAILFCMVLSKQFVRDMRNNKKTDHDEFIEKEQKSDELADWLANYIQQKGYHAYSQSEKNNEKTGNYNSETRSSNLPHKTIARIAGLGFIGKNNLLVTEDYGCAFSMCTVLTDAPIITEKHMVIPSKCGVCNICKDICPSNAIKGNEWSIPGNREDI